MPEISSFYGIRITLYFKDHLPPHFHATYGDEQAAIDIRSGALIEGDLPRRALRLVQEWTEMHQEELLALWDLAQEPAPLGKIAPLP